MKKLSLFIFSFFFFVQFSIAQNLVPNPSFEDTLNCVQHYGSPNASPPWFNPTGRTPDYFSIYPNCGHSSINNPTGFQMPHIGNAYAGIIDYLDQSITRDYVEMKLPDTLIAGRTYLVSFYVSLANESGFACDKIGAYFSSDSLINYSTFGMLSATPQIENSNGIITDTSNWVLISGTFVAIGNEQFMTIGNFYDNSNTDTTIMGGTPLLPNDAYYYIDDVSVIDNGNGINQIVALSNSIKIIPNPSFGSFDVTFLNEKPSQIRLYDFVGRLIYEGNNFESRNVSLESGTYLFEFIFNQQAIHKNLIIAKI